MPLRVPRAEVSLADVSGAIVVEGKLILLPLRRSRSPRAPPFAGGSAEAALPLSAVTIDEAPTAVLAPREERGRE